MNDKTVTLKILALDDEPGILNTLKRQLRPTQYALTTCSSGQEALQLMSNETFHIVLSDMRMPNMDGATFLTEVFKEHPETVRILLTGYSEMDSTIKAINEGRIFSYLAKPWDQSELLSLLDRARDHYISKRKKHVALVKSVKSNKVLQSQIAIQNQELHQSAAFVESAQAEISAAYDTAIEVMANLIDMQLPASAGVNREVAQLSTFIGQHMGLNADELRSLKLAGLLFQVGKLGMDQDMTRTPYEGLSQEQKIIYNEYPLRGEHSLTALSPLHDVTELIKTHQETMDGTGFPLQLKLSECSLAAQILSCVVKFKELSKGFVFQAEMTESEAVKWMRTQGNAYAPDMLDILDQLTESDQSSDMNYERLAAVSLRPGMVLAKDIFGKHDMLILSKGHTLDGVLIKKLALLESSINDGIYVYESQVIENDSSLSFGS